LDALRSLARRVLLPDSFVTWIPGATFAAIRAARRRANGESTVIVSSGAPFSAHIVGAVASAITRIPLVLDYGDPWVYEPGFPKRGLRLWLERGIERWVLRCASAVSFTTQATADLYRVKYRDVLPLPIVLPMGFDESDFQIASDTATETCSSGPIRFVYTGRLTREYRSLSTFASFLAHIDSLALTRDDILFEFYGMEQARVEDELSEFVRKGLVIIKESVDHRIFVRTLCDADGVLVFGNNNYIQVPGKIAQCIGARRPILYLPNVEDVDRDPSFEVLKRIIVEGVFVCRNRSEFDAALTFVREKKSIVVNEAAMCELNWNVIGRNLVNVIRLVSDGGKPDKGCGRRNGTERE